MSLDVWRDLAVILLALELFLAGLIPLVLFFFGIRGMRWLERQARTYGPITRERWHQVDQKVHRVMKVVRRPFEKSQQLAEMTRAIFGLGEDVQ